MSKLFSLNFDVDRYLNRIVPRSRLYLLPKPASWFLGHREAPRKPIGNVAVWFWSFIGAFAGILVIEAVFMSKVLQSDGAPIIIASLGAAAVLEYQTIDSPLSQPRNALFGQIFASVIGVGITKLFKLNSNFEDLRWVAGALSVGLASSVMGITKTIHPPAGATALLASTSPDIEKLGWMLVPLIILGSVLMLAVACVVNNIQRTFPIYWWTPVDLNPKTGKPNGDEEKQDKDEKNANSNSSSSFDDYVQGTDGRIVIDGEHIAVPSWVELGPEERLMLDVLRQKLREGEAMEREGEGLRNTPTKDSGDTHVNEP
ncbi:related to HPP family protein [Rhynchosporium agropyri]|uniref:Related to HPP family protein n=1 Tax=Rhynchosporium agropyri TaxID=914238 RepID=A0A1E1JZI4_9HELO|nr:related to HPP family protein [Rhynchosporium agropyri]